GSVIFNNTGIVDAESGTLAFNGGTGVSTGTFNAAVGTTNSFNGDYTFSTSSFTGSRNVVLAGGTLTFDGTFNFQNLQQTGGTLAGTNVFSGVFNWSGGNWNSVGATTIASNGVLNIVSGSDHDLQNHALTNYGTVVWSGGRVRGGGGTPGTIIANFGLWDAQSDTDLNADYGGSG